MKRTVSDEAPKRKKQKGNPSQKRAKRARVGNDKHTAGTPADTPVNLESALRNIYGFGSARRVSNAGGGHCGYLAFAQGLMELNPSGGGLHTPDDLRRDVMDTKEGEGPWSLSQRREAKDRANGP